MGGEGGKQTNIHNNNYPYLQQDSEVIQVQTELSVATETRQKHNKKMKKMKKTPEHTDLPHSDK